MIDENVPKFFQNCFSTDGCIGNFLLFVMKYPPPPKKKYNLLILKVYIVVQRVFPIYTQNDMGCVDTKIITARIEVFITSSNGVLF